MNDLHRSVCNRSKARAQRVMAAHDGFEATRKRLHIDTAVQPQPAGYIVSYATRVHLFKEP